MGFKSRDTMIPYCSIINYINTNYRSSISLDDIAAIGCLSQPAKRVIGIVVPGRIRRERIDPPFGRTDVPSPLPEESAPRSRGLIGQCLLEERSSDARQPVPDIVGIAA